MSEIFLGDESATPCRILGDHEEIEAGDFLLDHQGNVQGPLPGDWAEIGAKVENFSGAQAIYRRIPLDELTPR